MNSPVFSALLPVVLLVATGFVAGRAQWLRAAASQDLSNLVFMVLTPALLFRTMSSVHVEQLDFKPVAVYFLAAALLYGSVFWRCGRDARAAVLALTTTFSNTVMIGIPLVSLAYGQAALVTLFTLISVHALILLTLATLVLELTLARACNLHATTAPRHALWTIGSAIKSGIIHPVPLPIMLGLAFAQTGWHIPALIDRPVQLLGNAFGPIALLLVGATLSHGRVGTQWRAALWLSLLKNLALPALVGGFGYLLHWDAKTLTVLVVTASLPVGANVYLFAQRYQVAQDLVTASMAVSATLGLLSISLVMALI